jgi:hypothetical protein
VRATHTKNAASDGYRIVVDAFSGPITLSTATALTAPAATDSGFDLPRFLQSLWDSLIGFIAPEKDTAMLR